MAAIFDWESDHGTATGSPSQGTTRATGRTDINLKNIDNATTPYSDPSAAITAANNSMTTYLFAKFSGTYTSIFGGLFAHTSGTLGTGISIKSTVTSTYATPSAATNSALTTDVTSTTVIGSGATVLFTGTGPQTASPSSSTTANPAYSQYLPLQMVTTGSATPGDTSVYVFSFQYSET